MFYGYIIFPLLCHILDAFLTLISSRVLYEWILSIFQCLGFHENLFLNYLVFCLWMSSSPSSYTIIHMRFHGPPLASYFVLCFVYAASPLYVLVPWMSLYKCPCLDSFCSSPPSFLCSRMPSHHDPLLFYECLLTAFILVLCVSSMLFSDLCFMDASPPLFSCVSCMYYIILYLIHDL